MDNIEYSPDKLKNLRARCAQKEVMEGNKELLAYHKSDLQDWFSGNGAL